jgi:hypothetical protein
VGYGVLYQYTLELEFPSHLLLCNQMSAHSLLTRLALPTTINAATCAIRDLLSARMVLQLQLQL